jgi:hypothetical protein
MGKKMMGQKDGQCFFAPSFFARKLLTSEPQLGRCVPGFLSIALQRAVGNFSVVKFSGPNPAISRRMVRSFSARRWCAFDRKI